MNERELFLSALEIEDPAARLEHLKSICADDAEMLTRVEALLASHEGQSQFLNTPAVEQIVDDSAAEGDATVLSGNRSTKDEEPDAADSSRNESETMIQSHDDLDDEIPLGYLQPSTNADSLGRLAHYEILEVIGRGAFGIVLKAFDEKLQRVVAIKVLAPEMAATSPARKRFLREARASAAIRHENVVAIYAVDEQPIPYLVMEYIPGKTLQQRLDGAGPLDVKEVLRLGTQIAEGLAAAHAQDLIHRDIKPGNILLDESVNEHVKITDFGLARTADDASMTQSGMIAGTPMYMAPEQALGQQLNQRADLFSLGSVLYQMVSGRPPFRASSTVAVLRRVAEDTPRPIKEIIPETPDWLCELIAHLHAKDPSDRYVSAEKVADVLGKSLAAVEAGKTPQDVLPAKFASGESTTEKPASRKSTRLASNRLAQAAMIAIACLVFVGITEATGVTNLSSTVIQLVTGSGTLVIETDDDDVEFTVKRHNGEPVDGFELIGGKGQKKLRTGKYEVTLTGVNAGEFKITDNSVTLSRGNTATVTIERRVKEAVAVTNDALEFDGKSDHIETPVAFDGSHSLTLEARVQMLTNPKGNADIISQWYYKDGGISLYVNTDGKLAAAFDISQTWESKGPIALGRWIHVALTYDGSRFSIFQDGKKVSDSEQTNFRTGGLPFLIGAHYGDGKKGSLFPGLLDEVRISNIARYTEDFTPTNRFETDEHTLALYHFDEGTGNVLKDSSGNGHHGKIVGAKWVKADGRSVPNYKNELEIAKWVISKGGSVRFVDTKRKQSYIHSPSEGFPKEGRFVIDTITLKGSKTIQDQDMERISQLSSLGHMNLSQTGITDVGVHSLVKCRTLRWIDLDYGDISDDSLRDIATLPDLHEVSVGETAITDEGLKHLADKKKLDKLVLSGCRNVSDVGLKHLCGLDNLVSLTLAGTSVSDEGLEDLAQLKTLVFLDLQRGTQITASNVAALQLALPKCKISTSFTEEQIAEAMAKLDPDRRAVAWAISVGGSVFAIKKDETGEWLSSTDQMTDEHVRLVVSFEKKSGITDEGVAHLAGARRIVSLDLTGTAVTDQCVPHVMTLPNLESLILDSTEITNEGLRSIVTLPKLTTLHLYGLLIGDPGLALLSQMQQLRALKVTASGGRQNDFTDDGLAFIAKLTNLESLLIGSGHRATDTGIRHLSNLTKLKTLTLTLNKLTDASLEHISNLTSLESLTVPANTTDEGLRHLSRLKSLRNLSVGIAVTGAGLEHLGDLPRLEHLAMNNSKLNDAGLAQVSRFKKLKQLTIPNTKITESGFEHISKLPLLTRLDIAHNPKISLESMARLTVMIPECRIFSDFTEEQIAEAMAKIDSSDNGS